MKTNLRTVLSLCFILAIGSSCWPFKSKKHKAAPAPHAVGCTEFAPLYKAISEELATLPTFEEKMSEKERVHGYQTMVASKINNDLLAVKLMFIDTKSELSCEINKETISIGAFYDEARALVNEMTATFDESINWGYFPAHYCSDESIQEAKTIIASHEALVSHKREFKADFYTINLQNVLRSANGFLNKYGYYNAICFVDGEDKPNAEVANVAVIAKNLSDELNGASTVTWTKGKDGKWLQVGELKLEEEKVIQYVGSDYTTDTSIGEGLEWIKANGKWYEKSTSPFQRDPSTGKGLTWTKVNGKWVHAEELKSEGSDLVVVSGSDYTTDTSVGEGSEWIKVNGKWYVKSTSPFSDDTSVGEGLVWKKVNGQWIHE